MAITKKPEPLGVEDFELATAWRDGAQLAAKWLKETGSWLADGLKKGVLGTVQELSDNIGAYLQKIAQGGKELVGAVIRGDWKLFGQWAKNDPIGAIAGVGAIAGIAYVGVTGLIAGGTAFAGWAAGGSTGLLGAFKVGVGSIGAGSVLAGLTTAGKFLYNFEWQETDEQIDQAVDQAIENLYGPMGEFLGRATASLLVTGLTTPPRIEINMTSLALMYEVDENIREELLEAVSEFARLGIQTFAGIALKLAYKNVRQLIKKAYKNSPEAFKQLIGNIKLPGGFKLGTSIEQWGNPTSEPWSLKRHIDLEGKVEKIEDSKLRNLTEEFLESFWDSWNDSVSYVSQTK
ncbi:MAG: hypothetical protein VKK42_19560 [Lyngbya sp.]|nr:hypothetical protein [Lyngbya sp.]